MRIGIVVDSACDLPQDFIAAHNIVLLPITVRIGEAVLADHRDEQATLSFLHAHVAEHGAEAETIPFSVNQIRDLFLQQLPDPRQRAAGQLRHPQRLQAGAAGRGLQLAVRTERARHPEPVRRAGGDRGGGGAPARQQRQRAADPRAAGGTGRQRARLHGHPRPVLHARACAAQGRPQRRPAQCRAGQRAGHQAGAARLPRRDRAGGQDQGLRQRGAEAVRGGWPARACRPDDADRVCQLRR
ncbi:hypothetical protein G6F51_013686 [Rhizopus arrhizus]|uniref:DegV family protein n=1 Tax=Rhizopus oryzae TaxID=64495 RepID=A0A9P7C0U0_RHIOR|nr:hypothetical protein G6F51_013686 [Rhizopus arrhizus]